MRAARLVLPLTLLSILVADPALAGKRTRNAERAERHARAEAGDAAAQMELCRRYDMGDGEPDDPVAAATWCRRAAEQGVAEAQNAIGSMHLQGDGAPQSNAQALKWFELAAAQGDVQAINSLGYMHDLGLGTPEADAKAVGYYRRAVELGDPSAMLNLGIMMMEGTGTPRDPVEGFAHIELARSLTGLSQDMRVKWRIRGAHDEYKLSLTGKQLDAALERARILAKAPRPPAPR